MQAPESDQSEIGAKVFDWMARQISPAQSAKVSMGRTKNANWLTHLTPTNDAPGYVGRRTYRNGVEIKEGNN